MTISLTNVSVNDYQLQITIENQTDEVLLIAKNQFDIQVDAEPAETATRRYHCGHLKTSITQGIEEYIDQHGSKNFLGRDKYLKLSPSQPYPLNISLIKFKDHPFFHKIEHDFTITIKLNPQVEHLGEQCTPSQFKIRLQWYPMRVHLLTPTISEPSKSTLEPSERGQLMLEYRDTKPFYLNVSESSNLQLWISGNDTKAWTTHEKSQLTLNGSLTVDLEDLPENSQFDATLTQQITQQFKLQSAKVIEHKEGLLLIIPINNPQARIQQDSHATLKVSLSSSTKPKQSLNCNIPVLLQRPSFPGRVTLDFGTTNSAIAYYDPNSGIPTFTERTFSDSQLDKLNKTIEQLMGNISKAVINNKHYQVVSDQLIQFAKTMWRTDPKGNQVNSVDAIKQHFKYLKRTDEDAVKIGEYQANLLVSWGNIGYNNLKINQAPLEILNFVTQHYLQALDDIIDVDIEKDAHSDLPELDTGQRNGTIPSDIMLRSLEPSATEKTAQGIWKGIDGLRSNIDMGEAVKSSLSDKQENLEQNALLDIPKDDKERHNFYLSGTKRGIGLKDTSYFIDKKNEVFLDTYDPLCVSAIKELLTRTEEHVDKQRSCLNDLVVTYPANLPQYRRETYRNIIHSLGVARVDMSFDEATAGALYYIWRELFKDLFAGIDGFLARSRVKEQVSEHPVTGENRQIKFYYQNILLYDMGGGTTDIALLEIGLEEIENLLSADKANSGRYFVIRPKILGLTGLETFGGDNVTLAVFRILKSKLAATTAKLLLDNENKHN
ncbi:MAG: hypothetical protein VSS52_010545, partial [Thiotrichaceae bacterium]|nr:hypothetical protein [Thiotrichaceae bacterium]